MLDIKFIRENGELIRAAAKKKRVNFDLEELIRLDDERLKLAQTVQALRSEQNKLGEELAKNKSGALLEKLKELKGKFKTGEDNLRALMGKWQRLMLQVPNVPDISVPDGETDADNQEIRVWGEKPRFNFTPQDHITLMTKLKMAHLEPGTKVSGFRGYFLENAGVELSLVLWHFALKELMAKGFEAVLATSLLKKEAFLGTGYLPQGEDDLYKTQDETYLSGTAEVAIMGSYLGERHDHNYLPKKIVAFSPCFRREAGSHGKDTRGLIRVHEFYKVEQVVLCEASHDESVRWHEALTKNAEGLMQNLGLPYRVVANCGGDLGLGQVKKYDIEVWMPSEGKYRETHSISYFHDFQTRRLDLKYRDNEGKLRFMHSLNGTAMATPRLLAAIVENYQQADGSINLPESLAKYLGYAVIGPTV